MAPNLTWMPTSSADPREEHAVFWRDALTLPVSDPFWDEHRPGDLWNCKCWLKQTDAPATPRKEIPKGKGVPKPANGLETNPGKTAEMFSSKQPHYPDPKTCIWLRLAKGKGAEAKAGRFRNAAKCIGNCNNCELLYDPKKLCEQMTSYKVGRGKVQIHPLVDSMDSDFKKLIDVAEFFAKDGETVTLTPKMSRPNKFKYKQIYGDLVGTKYENKCPDLKVGDKWYEHEGFISNNPKNAFRNMMNDGLKQSSRLILDEPNLRTYYMINSIRARILRGESIEEVWIRRTDGKLELLYKNTDD